MALITMIERKKAKYKVNYNKKEIFSEIRDIAFEQINDVRLSSLKNPKIIEEIKTLKIIELDNLKGFDTYANYDHYLIFKVKDDYYFCDTDLIIGLFFCVWVWVPPNSVSTPTPRFKILIFDGLFANIELVTAILSVPLFV